MKTPHLPFMLVLVLVLASRCAAEEASTAESIIFTTLGRAFYAFDIYSLPIHDHPQTLTPNQELQLTDGHSVNFNGHFIPNTSSIQLPTHSPPLQLVYITERNGSPTIYYDALYTCTTTNLDTRIQVPLLPNSPSATSKVSIKDKPSVTPDGQYLLYVSTHEDPAILPSNAPLSTDSVLVERVTPPGLHAFTPATSPGNKNFIAVATRRAGSAFRHIELFDLVKKEFTELTRLVSPRSHHLNPFLSPDSTRVGYHKCRGEPNAHSSPQFLLENVRSPVPNLTLFRFVGSFPVFSPAGDRIAYVEMPGVYVVNRDGSNLRKVSNAMAFSTAWDRVRAGVIYTAIGETFASESSQVDIVSMDVDEGNSVKRLTLDGKNNALTEGPWTDTMCNWSPDGEWIAFASDRHDPGSGSFELYLIRPDGSGLRKLVESGSGGRANHPYFSPDGKRLTFTSDYAGISAEPISNPHHYQPYGEIFSVRLDGSDIKRLTHNSYEDGTPAWSPKYIPPLNIEKAKGGPYCSFEDCHWLNNMPNWRAVAASRPHCAAL
uniref:Protein tolB n=1 Tax=Cajanus cajan TaxID=3821 RepID=A0A151TSH3_CAJCA|nr:Protein tolB [Cajanus cajan]